MPEVTVASFNTHSGTDGWGRPFDLVAACRKLDADVIALQEVFSPLNGPSQAEVIAAELGYRCVELPLARAWRRREPIWHGKGWEPRRRLPRPSKPLRVGDKFLRASVGDYDRFEEGKWGLAILSRPEIVRSETIELGKLKKDLTRRGALVVEIACGDCGGGHRQPFTVIGTHAAHLTAGSPVQFRLLQAELGHLSGPAALAGDMNLWGPPLKLLMPGWSRAVKGRTWPAWRPHSQTDHILVNGGVNVVEGRVIYAGNSDHRAVRAELAW